MKLIIFEIFIQGNKVHALDWQRLIEKIWQYDKKFFLEISFSASQIEFFLYSKKDISAIGKLEGFLLKPVTKSLPEVSNRKKITFKIANDKNILEIREKEEIKNEKLIEKVIVYFCQFFGVKYYKTVVFLTDKKGGKFYSSYFSFTNPFLNFEFDFSKNIKLKKKTLPLFLKIEEAIKLFSEKTDGAILEVFSFPYFSKKLYFPLKNFEFGKHTLIVGQTGVGKSKLIELFVKKLALENLTDEYRVVVIDPHAALYSQFLTLKNIVNFDFVHSFCELFPAFSEPKIATELTILLFKTLLKDQFNAKMERVLKYVLYLLFLKNQMSLLTLKKFLTELEFRQKILKDVSYEYDYLSHFFDTEFVEMQTKFYEIAIMPVLVLIDELTFVPAFFKESPHQLETILKEKFLTCFSLNRIFLGEKATRLIAGLLIQQVFLLAQKRSINKKIILIIDEVSLVENESLIAILSEARKFNLSLFLSQQYLTQISPALLQAVLSNVYNYFVFKVSDEDAKILAKNLEIKFADEVLIAEKEKGLGEEEIKRKFLVTQNPRECLVRVFSLGKFFPCFKAKTLAV
jgi:hypothetical protein